MSTRSYVGIIKDGKVKYGYHHSDSHLESLGIELFCGIKNEQEFIKEISRFADIDNETSKENYFEIPNMNISMEFCYGFDTESNEWFVSSRHFLDHSRMYKLTDVIQNDEEMNCYASMYYEEYRDGIIKEIRKNIS